MAIDNLYNVDNIVEILRPIGVTKTSIYRAINTGKLKSIRLGKRYIVTEEALSNFLNGGEIKC